MSEFDSPFINSLIVSYGKISLTQNFFVIYVQAPEFTSFDVFFNLTLAGEGNSGKQSLVILNDLISPLMTFVCISITMADDVENEVGYIMIERTSNPVGF